MRYLIIFVLLIFSLTFFYRIYQLRSACRSNFMYNSQFSLFDLSLRIADAHMSDGSGNAFIARSFHNKAGFGVFDILTRYVRLFDTPVLFTLLSPFGTFFLIYGSITGFKKSSTLKALVFFLFLIPIWPIFSNFGEGQLQLLGIVLPRYLISLFGVYYLLTGRFFKKRIWLTIIFVLLVSFLTFTYFIYNWGSDLVCS